MNIMIELTCPKQSDLMIGQHLWADLDIAIGEVCGNYGINGKIEAIIYRCGWRMARVLTCMYIGS